MKTKYLSLLSALLLNLSVSAQLGPLVEKEISVQSGYAIGLCKYLHQHPELSLQEKETAKRMVLELEQIGFEVTPNFAGNSVVGTYKNGQGPTVMLRADMDALPVQEKNGLDFASTVTAKNNNGDVVPVMHACGHDIHMAVWLGALRTLVLHKDQWKGTLLVIAQQAEEMNSGAGMAIETGLFQKFGKPDYALAFHINPEMESGKIGLVSGPVFAGVKTALISVYGKGGHGAYPEKCIDPVVIASRIVLDLQTIVSRENNPLQPLVITVGSIHGGTRPNIIPDEVKMELTLRYYNEEVIERTIKAIQRVCNGAAQTAGMPADRMPDVKLLENCTPPVINNDILSIRIKELATSAIGIENVVKVDPSMAGEDFGRYGLTPEKVPICLIWLGSTNPGLMKQLNAEGKKPAPLHSPYLLPDYERTIQTGIKVMTANVMGLLK